MIECKRSLSIVIVSFNSEYYLERALDSIEAYNDIEFCEVVIVDNSTEEISFGFIDKYGFDIKVIPTYSNLGFGVANNLGVSNSAYDNILLLNLDAALRSSLSSILMSLTVNQSSIIGAIMYDDNDLFKISFGTFPDSVLKVLFPSKMYSIPLNDSDFKVDWIEASFLAFTKNNWKKIGGFDPSIFMYGEDLLLCYSASKVGVTCLVDVSLHYTHTGGYDDSKYGNIFKGIDTYLRSKSGCYNKFLVKFLYFSLVVKFAVFKLLSKIDVKYKERSDSLFNRFFHG
ncbi:glycosyltransferase [Marisediminitalea aggregata]|uniref:glycosyltransferase family 2 protein n=1 Tax=Marisediminitalea aggregata TaxID=634436 RepID=UPI0020CBBDA1|nr:glycosyltransferase [Marisediminitalea aggregata]MCP9478497.1 glycosyltransferase [Marisediminitalea aggregata]|tara:strand:+ start:3728 stop:4582 length:855 start_codon:yes stop_codon:yes gene_type:complete